MGRTMAHRFFPAANSSILAQADWYVNPAEADGMVSDLWLVDQAAGRNHAQFGSTAGAAILPYDGAPGTLALHTTASNGNYGHCPNPGSYKSDFAVVVDLSVPDITPAAQQIPLAQWDAQAAWQLRFRPPGDFRLTVSEDGTTAAFSATSTASLSGGGITAGQRFRFAFTYQDDNGLGQYQVEFWISTDGGSTWELFGGVQTGGVTGAMFDSASDFEVGASNGGASQPAAGNFYSATIYDSSDFDASGPGGNAIARLDPDTDASIGATSWVGSVDGLTWTVDSSAADTNDPLPMTHTGDHYLYLPGTAGNYASTPTTAALDITGDIAIVSHVMIADWTPGSVGTFASKYNGSADGSYFMGLNTNGRPYLGFAQGAGYSQVNATAAFAVSDGDALRVAVAVDADNGAGGADVSFWQSTDGTVWTQVGATVTTGAPITFDTSTAPLRLGMWSTGSEILGAGRHYGAQVYDGAAFDAAGPGGTLVADFNPTDGYNDGKSQTGWTGSNDGLDWSVNVSASGAFAAMIYRPCIYLHTDDYCSVADADVLDIGPGEDVTTVAWFMPIDAHPAPFANQYVIAKRDTGGGFAGWAQLSYHSGINRTRFLLDDGVGQDLGESAGPLTDRTDAVLVGTREAGVEVIQYQDGMPGTPVADNDRDCANSSPLTVGAWSATYLRGLVYGAARIPVAATAGQVAQITAELEAVG